MKVLTFLVVLISASVLVWYVYTNRATLLSVPETTPLMVEEEVVPVRTSAGVTAVTWDFRLIEDGVGDPMFAPQSDVAASFTLSNGEVKGPYRLGSFEGSCSEQSLDTVSVSGAVSRAMCWFAGAGTEFVVAKQGASIRVFVRGVDEGTAEVASPEQSFTEQLTVEL